MFFWWPFKMISDSERSWRTAASIVLRMNMTVKAVKPAILIATQNSPDHPIILRMLYTFTNGAMDWGAFFLLDVIHFFILSVTAYEISKRKIYISRLNSAMVFLLLDLYYVVCDVIKLDTNNDFGLRTIHRISVEKEMNRSLWDTDAQLRRAQYSYDYPTVALFVSLYFIAVVVAKLFSAFIIYCFKSESNQGFVDQIQDSTLHQLVGRRAIDCEEAGGSAPVAPSAPSLDEVCTVHTVSSDLVPSPD